MITFRRSLLASVALGVLLATTPARAQDGAGALPEESCAPGPRPDCASLDVRRATARVEPGPRGMLSYGVSVEAPSAQGFGDPLTDTWYHVCVYQGPDDRLVYEAPIPPGGRWHPIRGGFRYVEQYGIHGGVRSVMLRTAASGMQSVAVLARGPAMRLADAPPFDLPVTAELFQRHGPCWQVRFDESVCNRNDVGGLSARMRRR